MSRWHGPTLASFGDPRGNPLALLHPVPTTGERTVKANASRIADPADQLTFLTGGRAIFTVVSRRTGSRFTYRVSAPREDDLRPGQAHPPLFVSVLTGPDNTRDYTFLGTLFPSVPVRVGGRLSPSYAYRHGKKSRIGVDAPSAAGFEWIWRHLTGGNPQAEAYEFWHEGRCCRCARTLTTPDSVARGIGPDCADKMGA